MHIHPSIDVDYVLDNMHSDYEIGWCIGCGAEIAEVPRLDKDEPCPECGARSLYGSFALCELLTGEPAPRPN